MACFAPKARANCVTALPTDPPIRAVLHNLTLVIRINCIQGENLHYAKTIGNQQPNRSRAHGE
jgi:hypothetical protein